MPTKISSRPLLKPVNGPKQSTGTSGGWRSVAVGVLTAVAVVAIGRQLVGVASSTLSGWTALFLLAVFFGLIATNSMSYRRFVSPMQAVIMVCGAVSSLATLFLMYSSPTAASTTSLGIATMMFVLTMIMGFQYRSTKVTTFSDRSLELWAIRLDDLLKYDLDQDVKTQLVNLIEALWHSPKDQEQFIPAQSQSFEELLNALEESVRRQDLISIHNSLDKLARCLAERNQLIHAAVNVSYRRLGPDTGVLPDKSRAKPTKENKT